jgi:probable addiction module antidote protein
MNKIEVSKWDVADYLETEEDIIGFLEEVLKDNDPEFLMEALGDVARARSMTKVSRKTGLGRESLYKSLRKGGNPSFATVQKVLTALGLKFSITKL